MEPPASEKVPKIKDPRLDTSREGISHHAPCPNRFWKHRITSQSSPGPRCFPRYSSLAVTDFISLNINRRLQPVGSKCKAESKQVTGSGALRCAFDVRLAGFLLNIASYAALSSQCNDAHWQPAGKRKAFLNRWF
ncbi:hypothetical protein CDAR_275151 [Caerostris darwini]|uniref:Uncharacterized protein n=1 Tax=Caerostris darwini TaxID=1538125 RepID=A0AAV4SYM3_9ARAC|nr:hypothetical protein CDAR_275151 [Caerostris darwini]